MADLSVKLEGVNEIRKAFEQSPRIFAPIFNRGIQSAVMVFLGTSRMKTPVDTGFLRGAGYSTSFEALVGRVENNASYALFVHDGTSKMDARPFMEWGIDDGMSQVNDIFDKCLSEFNQAL